MSEKNPFRKTKWACYYTYVALSSVFSLPPILFVTFREMYQISYTLLGTLVLVNFCTQLTVDLLFTVFAKKLPVHRLIRVMPCLTTVGLFVYALVPLFFPQYAYFGLLFGTVIFSVSSGLCEVLISPMVAAMPSDNPEKDMSRLHSLYGYGVVLVAVVSTLLLFWWGREQWMWVTLFWAVLPIGSAVMFSLFPLPDMTAKNEKGENKTSIFRKAGIWLCVLFLLLGAAAEIAMTNWVSVYAENALGIPKVLGDLLGLVLFSLCLALVRTGYAKFGKNIERVLLISMICAVLCYALAGLSPFPAVGLTACVLCGFATSMLWPGALIFTEKHIPKPGVAAYAFLAAGGDLGGAILPQLLGVAVDFVSATELAGRLGERLSLTPEQVGIKAAMLFGALFPLIGIAVVLSAIRYFARQESKSV